VTGHLARLALRATRPANSGSGGLRPRTPSLFERSASVAGLPEEYAGEPVASSPPPVASARAGDTAAEHSQLPSAEAVDRSPGQALERPRARSAEVEANPLAPAPAAHPVEPGNDRERIQPAPDSREDGSPAAPAASVALDRPPLVEQVTQAVTSQLAEIVAAPLGGRASPPDPPVALADAGTARDAATHAPAQPGDETSPAAVVVRAIAPEPTVPAKKTANLQHATPLPRLTPAPPAEPDKPGVTVNIGRIEVLPPPKAQPPAPPPVRKRESGAPKLADYLRDRSRR